MLTTSELDTIIPFLPFWTNLTDTQKQKIKEQCTKVVYTKGSAIYSSIKECVGLILIQSGCLRTYLLSEDGKDITLYRMLQNDSCVLSASCLMNNITFDIHIDAEEDTIAYVISAPLLASLIKENIYVENYTYKRTIDRFSDVMWTMEQILFMSFDKRLAIFLLDEINKTHTDTITLTHAQIAKYIGSAREVVSRMLKHFESDHILTQSRGKITIIDRKKLLTLTL